MSNYDIGMIGLGVMGQNLALNMESNGYRVAVYDKEKATTKKFKEKRAKNKKIKAVYSLEELVGSLSRPKKVMLMIKAGKPVDIVINNLLSFLEAGDIIIDGGNSYFKDTASRCDRLEEEGIFYLGTGISGGEYGALYGPSIMAGGNKKAFQQLEELLKNIAANTENGPCVTYLGPKGSGHYVKMVHNGIEYGIMQIIAEVYDFMRKIIGLNPAEIGEIVGEWNQNFNSYLLEITEEILKKEDPRTGKFLIDVILDKSEQKGTGKWSVQEALKLGVPVLVMGAAVNARLISAKANERKQFKEIFRKKSKIKEEREGLEKLKQALALSLITAYAEGMKLLQAASREYNYNFSLDEVAQTWENGCIIRSSFLNLIKESFQEKPKLTNLVLAEDYRNELSKKREYLRWMVGLSQKDGSVPTPAMSAVLNYYDSLGCSRLPASLIQAQRDYFGAHTYQRRDAEGDFHTEWKEIDYQEI